MKTKCFKAVTQLIWRLTLATVFAGSALVVHGQIANAAPDFRNAVFNPSANISGSSLIQYDSLAAFSGNIGQHGLSTTPSDGATYLARSVIGQPVAGPPATIPGTQIYRIGELIVPPPELGINASVPPSSIVQPDAARFIDGLNRVVATSPGFVQIEWIRTDGSINSPIRYYIVPSPVQDPMALYHTHASGGNLDSNTSPLSSVPRVWVPEGLQVALLYNAAVSGAEFAQFHEVSREMRARSSEGLLVLVYRNADGDYLSLEVVDVRRNAPTVTPVVDLGFKLEPSVLAPSPAKPWVSAGLNAQDPAQSFVYQHENAASPQFGEVYAIRATDIATNIEVYWRRLDSQGVEWPFEMDRYITRWPTEPSKYQLYVRDGGNVHGPDVVLPVNLDASLMPFMQPDGHAQLANGTSFASTSAGWSLLKYAVGIGVDFQVVRSVLHTDSSWFNLTPQPWNIGDEIIEGTHQGTRAGYIHSPEGDRFDWETYQGFTGTEDDVDWTSAWNWNNAWTTKQIFPVNEGILEVWWSSVNPKGSVQWPSLVRRYSAEWPEDPERIVIASQQGTGPLDPAALKNFRLYYQNDPARPGFNPNDEHALSFVALGGQQGAGNAVFALRDDLGSPATSQPYLLLKYQDPEDGDKWRFRVLKVLAEGLDDAGMLHAFNYDGEAGKPIVPPYPLDRIELLDPSAESHGVSGPYWRDRKLSFHAMAAGDDGGSAEIVMRYFYSTRTGKIPGLYFPPDHLPAPGTHVPWLDRRSGGTPGTPTDITYTVTWPVVPELRVGETLVKPKFGLPDISKQTSVEIIYQQSQVNGQGESVKLIDATRIIEVADVLSLPGDVVTESSSGLTWFPTLPPHLRPRFWYDPTAKLLQFEGLFVEPPAGEYYLLLNVITDRDREELLKLSSDGVFRDQINALADKAAQAIELAPDQPFREGGLALTAGLARGTGYVTLAFGNSTTLTPVNESVALSILKVKCPLYQGEIKDIPSAGPFDEKLTMRHKGDFAGRPGDYEFEWRTLPPDPDTGGAPTGTPFIEWDKFVTQPASGEGAVDIIIEGSSIYTLSDNYFVCRYRPIAGVSMPCGDGWSDWTPPQLAEGWIKRVIGRINPFTQRAEGGGLEGAETRFGAFNKEVNTIVSMISQAGPRFEGAVPFNAEAVNDFGLIEIYETVLKRGIGLSIEGNPPMDYGPANDALLLAAGRLSDLYMLLGNEAYADASDPTIAFGTTGGEYGAEASSIHCFQNQTSSLLEEELALLRGRDDRLQPGVTVRPVYNRLVWNFTGAQGEVAYAANYGLRDNTEPLGTIDEADAKIDYPQGHGDAWGHYLSAIKGYYQLLRNPHFTWVPRSEAVLVGGVPVQVDYLDERKFAKAAAAKAQAGAEIVSLTYRDRFSEDPAFQWQGYPDADQERAWGVSDWGGRAGQAALFDWAVGNALLPPSSPGVGIQKIDRTTVTELRDIAASFLDVQTQVDKGDSGLNPLGLTKNSIPFDIVPFDLLNPTQNKTHFEQIYDRAVSAMNNAIAVFNHANNSSQALRKQSDSINEFQNTVEDREADFTNRLIEVFGYPYGDDIGPTGTYADGYSGPDLYNHMLVDPSALLGEEVPETVEFTVQITEPTVNADGSLSTAAKALTFHLANNGLGLIKPPNWEKPRRAPGELQRSHSDLIQAKARFERALGDYENLLTQIEDQAEQLRAQYELNAKEIGTLVAGTNLISNLNDDIRSARARQLNFQTKARQAALAANAVTEAFPKIFGVIAGPGGGGTIGDWTGALRSAALLAGNILTEKFTLDSNRESLAELDHQQAKELAQSQANVEMTILRQELGELQQLRQLEQLIRQEILLRLDLYTQQEAMQQAAGNYAATLARAQRILDERLRFRQQTAAQIQVYRYQDMAFRIFRNDSLQKYRAQFDAAATYVYLAAKAYDFETNLRPGDDAQPGREFLNQIVRARTVGVINSGGIPEVGFNGDPGLADPMARMSANFASLKTQLGFNNPSVTLRDYSLRSHMLRVLPDAASSNTWREALSRFRVEDLSDIPEIRQYLLFEASQSREPGLVIPFSSTVNQDLNYFGWPAGAGDSSFNPSAFSTKLRSVTVAFSNFRTTGPGGMQSSVFVYLVPIGNDIARTPRRFVNDTINYTREWRIVDQWLPAPFRLSGGGDPRLTQGDWIPLNSIQSGEQPLGSTRGHAAFEAWHDSLTAPIDSAQFKSTRLVGRSVWNTHWLLVIPGVSLLPTNREEGLDRFIHGGLVNGIREGRGVSDIRIRMEAYSFSGR